MGKGLIGSLELNRIYQMDCLEGMRLIPDGSIDMILCDLPYGITTCSWDSIIPFEPLWEQYKRIIKEGRGIILFGTQPFATDLINSNREWFKYELIWNKVQGYGMTTAKIMPLKNHENILVFGKGKILYSPQMIDRDKPIDSRNWKQNKRISENGNYTSKNDDVVKKEYKQKYPNTILTYHRSAKECNNTKRVHPTQKPVDLFSWLIKTYTNENDIILDNCMGSGTTAIAALETIRNFIGFETESKYVEIANKRIHDYLNSAKEC